LQRKTKEQANGSLMAVDEVINEAGTGLGSFPGGRLLITRVGTGFGAGTRIVNGVESRSSTGSESLAVAGAESLAVADAVSVAEAGAVSGAGAVVQKLERSFSPRKAAKVAIRLGLNSEIKGEGGVKGQARNGTHGLFKPDVQAPERV
jgi:hypothetical protein